MKKLILFSLLLFLASPAYAVFRAEIPGLDQTGVSVSADLTVPCPSGQALVSSGGGTWTCGDVGDITSVGSACTSGACDSISIADGQKIDLSAVIVNTSTDGLFVPAYNAGGVGAGQCSYDGTNDIMYCGNGTTAAPVNLIFMHSGGPGTSATRYTMTGGFLASATETLIDNYVLPRNCIMQNFTATIDNDPGGVGNSWDVTLRDDLNPTSMTCNIGDGTTQCVDVTNRPTIAGGSKVTVHWLRNGTAAASGNLVATWECVPI